MLNAKHHEEEGQIVARAYRPGTVTVATNMAGRGTDIVLGGNPEVILDEKLRERGLDPFEDEERYQEAWDAEIEEEKERSKRPVTKSARLAASTSWAPSVTSPAVSITSCVAVPAVRVTQVRPASTCPCVMS